MKRWIRCLAAVLCLKWIVFGTAFADAENKGSLSLLAINVRKADCLLLRSGNSAYLVRERSA